MLNNLKLILFAIPLFILSVTASQAVVELVDIEDSGNRSDIDFNTTQGFIGTGSGFQGDYEVIMCSTFSDGNNFFLDPTPGDWSTIDSGDCGGNGQCIQGIFGRFDESTGSTDISCNWTDPTSVFAAGSFRYRGVDTENPVIDIACNSGGSDTFPTAPSVITEVGSAVIVVATYGEGSFNIVKSAQVVQGGFEALGLSNSTGQAVDMIGVSFAFPEGGPTGTHDFGRGFDDWRMCTIALRMEPTEIPTLSEWGLGVFVVLTGIAAVWALRRRSVKASV